MTTSSATNTSKYDTLRRHELQTTHGATNSKYKMFRVRLNLSPKSRACNNYLPNEQFNGQLIKTNTTVLTLPTVSLAAGVHFHKHTHTHTALQRSLVSPDQSRPPGLGQLSCGPGRRRARAGGVERLPPLSPRPDRARRRSRAWGDGGVGGGKGADKYIRYAFYRRVLVVGSA